jgi:2-iminobutanoate/2-iminopropanoate deaminase
MDAIHPQSGPAPAAGYTPAIRAAGFVFVSGQIPTDDAGEVIGETIEEQVQATFRNLEGVLHAAGCTLSEIVRIDAYLADLADFDRYDAAYRDCLRGHLPTRTTVQAVLHGVRVEINAIAEAASA